MSQTWSYLQRLPSEQASYESRLYRTVRWLHHCHSQEEKSLRKQKPEPESQILTKNSYDILNQLPEDGAIQYPHKELLQTKGKNQKSAPPDPNHEPHAEKKGDADGDIPMHLDDRDLAGIDLEKLEESLNQKDLHALPEEQL